MDDLGKQKIIRNHLEAIEHILGTDQTKWSGGTKRFEYISDDDLEAIKRLGALDESERQNKSPSIRELRSIAKELSKDGYIVASFDGYIVSQDRPDSRISIDRLRINVPSDLVTIDLETKVSAIAQTADEFDRFSGWGSVTYELWWD